MPGPEPRPRDAHLELRGLRKSFGPVVAVDDFSLEVPRGSFTTLLGPSGCGKTTVLRMLAGFIEPDAGSIGIAGKDQQGLPPNLRGVGMVFQDYALFPHMSVKANVEYGLRMRRLPVETRRERSRQALDSLGLAALAERYPHELSGGQQQRVALGRVLALQPEVLLMDEPFSNLDASLRLRLRGELKELQRRLGITTVYVTHDQDEALSLSDQVVVMDRGAVQQVGTPRDVYSRPSNRFVASFVGLANQLPVEVVAVKGERLTARALGREVEVRLPDSRAPVPGAVGVAMLRPEHVSVSLADLRAAAAGSTVPAAAERGGVEPDHGHAWAAPATVLACDYFGPYYRLRLALDGVAEPWVVDVPAAGAREPLGPRTEVSLSLAAGTACWLW